MGKFIYALMMVVVIELGLWFFGGSGLSRTFITEMVMNPSSAYSSAFYILVVAALIGSFAASQIVAGNTFTWAFYAAYASAALVLVGFAWSVVHLAMFINVNLTGLIDADLTKLIIAVVCGPLLGFYFVAVLEWIRSNY